METAAAPLVVLPGQERWLFPGEVEGDAVLFEGEGPPPRLDLVEGL